MNKELFGVALLSLIAFAAPAKALTVSLTESDLGNGAMVYSYAPNAVGPFSLAYTVNFGAQPDYWPSGMMDDVGIIASISAVFANGTSDGFPHDHNSALPRQCPDGPCTTGGIQTADFSWLAPFDVFPHQIPPVLVSFYFSAAGNRPITSILLTITGPDAVVPLPAALPLFAAGLGGLWIATRRRRRG